MDIKKRKMKIAGCIVPDLNIFLHLDEYLLNVLVYPKEYFHKRFIHDSLEENFSINDDIFLDDNQNIDYIYRYSRSFNSGDIPRFCFVFEDDDPSRTEYKVIVLLEKDGIPYYIGKRIFIEPTTEDNPYSFKVYQISKESIFRMYILKNLPIGNVINHLWYRYYAFESIITKFFSRCFKKEIQFNLVSFLNIEQILRLIDSFDNYTFFTSLLGNSLLLCIQDSLVAPLIFKLIHWLFHAQQLNVEISKNQVKVKVKVMLNSYSVCLLDVEDENEFLDKDLSMFELDIKGANLVATFHMILKIIIPNYGISDKEIIEEYCKSDEHFVEMYSNMFKFRCNYNKSLGHIIGFIQECAATLNHDIDFRLLYKNIDSRQLSSVGLHDKLCDIFAESDTSYNIIDIARMAILDGQYENLNISELKKTIKDNPKILNRLRCEKQAKMGLNLLCDSLRSLFYKNWELKNGFLMKPLSLDYEQTVRKYSIKLSKCKDLFNMAVQLMDRRLVTNIIKPIICQLRDKKDIYYLTLQMNFNIALTNNLLASTPKSLFEHALERFISFPRDIVQPIALQCRRIYCPIVFMIFQYQKISKNNSFISKTSIYRHDDWQSFLGCTKGHSSISSLIETEKPSDCSAIFINNKIYHVKITSVNSIEFHIIAKKNLSKKNIRFEVNLKNSKHPKLYFLGLKVQEIINSDKLFGVIILIKISFSSLTDCDDSEENKDKNEENKELVFFYDILTEKISQLKNYVTSPDQTFFKSVLNGNGMYRSFVLNNGTISMLRFEKTKKMIKSSSTIDGGDDNSDKNVSIYCFVKCMINGKEFDEEYSTIYEDVVLVNSVKLFKTMTKPKKVFIFCPSPNKVITVTIERDGAVNVTIAVLDENDYITERKTIRDIVKVDLSGNFNFFIIYNDYTNQFHKWTPCLL